MSGWSKWGLKRKLFAAILLILVLNVVILLCMGSTLFELFYRKNKVAELKTSANQIRVAYQGNSDTIYDEISGLEYKNAGVSLLSIDESGHVVINYSSRTDKENMRPWGDKPDMPTPKKSDLERFEKLMLERMKNASEGLDVISMEPFDHGREYGFLTLYTKLDDNFYLFLETPLDYIKSTADLAVKYTALLSIAILLVGGVIIYFVVDRITKPIRNIQEVAEKISRLEFSQKCVPKGGDEIGKLAVSINHMAQELESSIGRLVEANEVLKNDLTRQQQTDRMRQQFIANVSHDFKTPLTLMISYAEALAERETDPERVESYGIIVSEGNKLSHMVGKLLELSRLENGIDRLQISMFCLSEVVDEAIKSHRILTERRNLQVTKRLEDEFIVSADYQKVERVVTNLFENAAKYAPEGGAIRVTAEKRMDLCRVSVENTGSNIAPDDMENLFESFYRTDRSRTRSAAGGLQSYGIGLAVVKAIMEAHGRAYGVENLENGVRFWFELALAELGDEEECLSEEES